MVTRQAKSFRNLLNYVWDHSVFYREYYGAHGIRERDLAAVTVGDLPFVTKKLLMENFDAVVTNPQLRKMDLEQWLHNNRDPRQNFHNDFVVIHSSGSSGGIGIFVYDRTAWQTANAVLASRLPPWKNDHSGKRRVAFYLASHGHFAAVSTAVRMPTSIYDLLILSVLDASQTVVKQLNDFQPHQLGGYASSVSALAELELKGRVRIHPERIVVGGDKLTASMERTILKAWEAPIHVVYSASESTFLALRNCGRDELTVMEDLNIVEVLTEANQPASPGGEGRVVLTNLYNYTLPILRYELEDYVALGTTDSRFTTIRDIKGRSSNALPVVMHDGTREAISHHVLGEFYVPGVEKIQFVSRRPDHVQVDYVGRAGLESSVHDQFQRILDMKGASGTTFEVLRKEDIANDPTSGKFAVVRFENSESNEGLGAIKTSLNTELPCKTISGDSAAEFVGFGEEKIEQSVIGRFEQQVAKYPDRVAVKTKNSHLTYAELNSAANRIARAILGKRSQGQEPIALLLENGAAIIASIFGVLKTGKLYMPLDPSYPAARIKTVLEDSQVGLILTNSCHLTSAKESAGSIRQVINLDEFDPSLSNENSNLPLSADTLACIIYTSGSTGEPKGVVHSHRNILHKTMEYTNALRFCAEDRIALLSPCTFSLSVGFIFGALLNGGCLYPMDVKGDGLAHLANWFAEEGMTVYNSVPALFRDFARTLTLEENLPKLRLIHLGGEPVTINDVELYKKHFSAGCVLVHHWGSNETGTIAQSFIDKATPIHGNTVPAGRPGEGSEILVLDQDGNPLGFNRLGEIAVKSRYLAVEYWRKPELTTAAFLPDPAGGNERIYRTGDLGLLRPDGSLEHCGRKDFQIKIRGQRVEVVEIDMSLCKHGGIKEAVTVAHEDTPGDTRLITYVVPTQRPAPTSKELRLFLEERLPDYMVPSVIVFLEAIPLTSNGKLDRRALPAPSQLRNEDTAGYVVPKEKVEHQLVEIWEKLLGIHPVGINDNFFDIGGHSLLLLKLHGELQATFGVDIPMVELFVYPTISTQAPYLRRMMEREPIEESGDLVERQRSALQRQRGLQAIASVARRGTPG